MTQWRESTESAWIARRANDAPLSLSIGICAHNEEQRIPRLLEALASERDPEGFVLREILVVASGCTDRTADVVTMWARRDARIRLVFEARRLGKASSINRLLERFKGDILVLVNGDAVPQPGALAQLVRPFKERDSIDVACAAPSLEETSGLAGMVSRLYWRFHNRTLQVLSLEGILNHCCDELMAIRRGFVQALPELLINDGAYFGALASRHRKTICFVSSARVHVAIPRTLHGLVQQRRRILRGHRQVNELLGIRPSTLEGMFRSRPGLVAQIIGAEFLTHPTELFAFLILSLPIEALALGLATLDGLRKRNYDPVWPRVELSS